MLNVACVKWGNLYGPEYVNNLYAMVSNHLGHEFKFHCFTDDPSGIDGEITIRSLPTDLSGWWNKLYLFSNNVFPGGQSVLYFDLDTVILKSIYQLGAYRADFAALRDFYRPRGIGSGVMAWESGAVADFWDQWNADGRPMFAGGDQAYIEIMTHRKWGHHILPHRVLQTMFPGMFASFKADCAEGPGSAAIICFHGQPKPHNCETPWVTSAWNTKRLIRAA